MELITPIATSPLSPKINHKTKILALGSCFVENIGLRLQKHGFNTLRNPFGIIYHPLVISNSLKRILDNDVPKESELLLFQERWHSWNYHSSFSNLEKNQTLADMKHSFELASQNLREADWMIITLGTAIGYRLPNNQLVANCHKYPSNHFTKEVSSTSQLIKEWESIITKIKAQNPTINLLLTVSPIRHKKDGLIENNRSKARCLLLAELLTQQFDYCHYFPAYEIQIDELRDYRFYASDLVHPNELAQDYIWEKFSKTAFSMETIQINNSILQLRKAADHRPFNASSNAHQTFLKKQLDRCSEFEKSFPFINIDEIKEKFVAQKK